MNIRATTTASFIEKSNRIHHSKYDYSHVEYTSSVTHVRIVCLKHGEFSQKPSIHMRGCGCPDCGEEAVKAHGVENRVGTDHILHRFRAKHGDRYDYSLVDYIKDGIKVAIVCKVHGIFYQNPANHYSGKGCYACGRDDTRIKKRSSTSVFIKKARLVHHDTYDYSLTNYTNAKTKVTILCKPHGEFTSTPNNHLQGYGCPRCGHRISQSEQDWLSFNNVPNTPETRQVILWANSSRYTVDGYIPETKTVYEFDGDYWHGNPKYHKPEDVNVRVGNKSFGEIYHNTLQKKQALISAGYNVISIWESDWLLQQNKPLYLKEL